MEKPSGEDTYRRTILQVLGGMTGAALLATASTGVSANEHGDSGTDMTYELPDLPYAYDALEPHIDERIMELHHTKHHQGYVDGANAGLEKFEAMREGSDFGDIRAAKRDYSFNLSGHVNHTIFWHNMSPDGGGKPSGKFCSVIEENFGSFNTFKREFTAAATNVEASGWAMLFYDTMADRLVIGQIEDQNELVHQQAVPILTLDVWEHAYYLQYENRRGEYVDAWWNVVDWEDVAQRYETITTLVQEHATTNP